ncbi:MAG: IS110 family transposase [Phycisphaerales bacterium]|nr:IS110 family transposase [Phycisphaerales bacterium]
MNVYIGFDISLQSTHICVVDDEGNLVREGVERSEIADLDGWLRKHSQKWAIERIVFETGQLSAHLYHGLRKSWPVVCIDARHAHGTLKAQRIKNDRNDARGLAQIARTGWYKAVHVKSEECQALRALVGGRKELVMLRLGLENHIRGRLKAVGIKLGAVTTAAFSTKVKGSLDDENPLFRQAVLTLLQARDDLLARQRVLDKQCVSIARADPVCKRLITVPGVGSITALSFRAEIDDPLRFRKSRDVGVHLGLTPKRYASGETDRSGGISKCGNRALRTLLFEASVTMLTRSNRWSRLKAWGVRLAQRTSFKAASVALARKIAIVMHRMWVDGRDFAYGEPPALQAA